MNCTREKKKIVSKLAYVISRLLPLNLNVVKPTGGIGAAAVPSN